MPSSLKFVSGGAARVLVLRSSDSAGSPRRVTVQGPVWPSEGAVPGSRRAGSPGWARPAGGSGEGQPPPEQPGHPGSSQGRGDAESCPPTPAGIHAVTGQRAEGARRVRAPSDCHRGGRSAGRTGGPEDSAGQARSRSPAGLKMPACRAHAERKGSVQEPRGASVQGTISSVPGVGRVSLGT